MITTDVLSEKPLKILWKFSEINYKIYNNPYTLKNVLILFDETLEKHNDDYGRWETFALVSQHAHPNCALKHSKQKLKNKRICIKSYKELLHKQIVNGNYDIVGYLLEDLLSNPNLASTRTNYRLVESFNKGNYKFCEICLGPYDKGLLSKLPVGTQYVCTICQPKIPQNTYNRQSISRCKNCYRFEFNVVMKNEYCQKCQQDNLLLR